MMVVGCNLWTMPLRNVVAIAAWLETMIDFTICPYCQTQAKLVSLGHRLYPHHRDYGRVWVCPIDKAYVGAHPNGLPLGRLADKTLRDAKIGAHRVFDPLWKDWDVAHPELKVGNSAIRKQMKGRAYMWLANQLSMPIEACHIGQFDVEDCRRVVELIDEQRPTAATVHEWAENRNGR